MNAAFVTMPMGAEADFAGCVRALLQPDELRLTLLFLLAVSSTSSR